jgi:hypothetical protein
VKRAALIGALAAVAAACGNFFPNPDNVVLPSGVRDYELRCRTVRRVACEALADKIVREKRAQGRVVRVLEILDDRGSYTITFLDGSGESMMVD